MTLILEEEEEVEKEVTALEKLGLEGKMRDSW